MNIAKKIAELRIAAHLSQNALAKKAGLGQATIREIEMGEKSPNIITLEKICTALEITLAEFFAEDDCIKVAEAPCGYGDYADLPKEAVERVEELIALYRLKYKTEKEAKK
jgi:transcriptional regulator with XRE-family HTH domain